MPAPARDEMQIDWAAKVTVALIRRPGQDSRTSFAGAAGAAVALGFVFYELTKDDAPKHGYRR